MESIWVVEQGSYSDYRVVGVFSSKKNAKMIADAINADREFNDKATVSEWPLDPAVADLSAGRRPHVVLMLRDGTVEDVKPWDVSGYELAGSVEIWPRSQAPAYRGKGVPDCLQATVWATDPVHAVKIVNEHRTAMIASGKWKSPDSPPVEGA